MVCSARPPPSYELGPVVGTTPVLHVRDGIRRGARDFRRPVSILTVRPDIPDRRAQAVEFTEAAAAFARLRDPSLLRIDDLAESSAGALVVTGPLTGTTLGRYLARPRASGPTPLGIASSIVSRIAEGVELLRSTRSCSLCNLGPDSIWMTAEGGVFLLPTAACAPRRLGSNTDDSPSRYLPPEVVQGRVGDPRSEAYTLALLFWDLVSLGRHPDRGREGKRTSARAIDASVVALVLRALSSDPAERPANAEVFRRELAFTVAAGFARRGQSLPELGSVPGASSRLAHGARRNTGSSQGVRNEEPTVEVLPFEVEPLDGLDSSDPHTVRLRDGGESSPRRLRVTRGVAAPRELSLDRRRSKWIVGRGRDADLVVSDPDVSREHFVVERDTDGSLRVTDSREQEPSVRQCGSVPEPHRSSRRRRARRRDAPEVRDVTAGDRLGSTDHERGLPSTSGRHADMLALVPRRRDRGFMIAQREFSDGDVIAGTRYRIASLIGSGGMGSVYEVEHVELGKRFVLKALLRNLANREDLVQRLRNEWRALGKLEHPNIVSVTDAGVTDAGVPFYVMERLQGETLSSRLRREGRLPLNEALSVAADVLDGLHAAHRIGVVHRDVKPPNVFLLSNRPAKLLDFGIAKMLDPKASQITGKGIAIGTPRYMAPEQATGETVDARTDIYATGLILFEMIAGVGPFDSARDSNELFLAHLAKSAPVLSSVAVGVSPEIDHWLALLLAKRPADRPSSAADVAAAFRKLAAPIARKDDVPLAAISEEQTCAGGPFDTIEGAATVPSTRPEPVTRTGIGPIPAVPGSVAREEKTEACSPPAAMSVALVTHTGETLRLEVVDVDEAVTHTASPAGPGTPPPVSSGASSTPDEPDTARPRLARVAIAVATATVLVGLSWHQRAAWFNAPRVAGGEATEPFVPPGKSTPLALPVASAMLSASPSLAEPARPRGASAGAHEPKHAGGPPLAGAAAADGPRPRSGVVGGRVSGSTEPSAPKRAESVHPPKPIEGSRSHSLSAEELPGSGL